MAEPDADAPRSLHGDATDAEIVRAFELLAGGGEPLFAYVGKILSDFVTAYNALTERGNESRALKFREEISELFFKKLLNKVVSPYDQGVLRHMFQKKMAELIPIRMEMKSIQVIPTRSGKESLFIPERNRYSWPTDQRDGGKITRHPGAE